MTLENSQHSLGVRSEECGVRSGEGSE
jgi:hypothetical protein